MGLLERDLTETTQHPFFMHGISTDLWSGAGHSCLALELLQSPNTLGGGEGWA